MKKPDYNQKGTIFNIQKFSLHDGPGIRTVVFFKGCPLRCKWCANPESLLNKPQILWDQKKCINCHHCVTTCPSQAISALKDRIYIDPIPCNNCKQCIIECPKKALILEGEIKTVKEILDIVMQDEVFYEESGGGITLSGGEFLTQPDFAMHLLLASKEQGLHTCCETTGFAKFEIFSQIIQYLDIILFDVKHWNTKAHKEGTGVSNQLPLANIKYAIEIGKDVLPRIPVIPAYNNTIEDALHLAELLHSIGTTRCQLLPFHQFGENKYHLLDCPYDYQNIPSLHKEDLSAYQQVFIDHHIDAFF